VTYWWVNQGGTYKHEVPGGYMWSPQRNNNGSYSQYYENMTRVEPGDVVLSYAGSEICALGVALDTAYESPKPAAFGAAGDNWADLGWRVDVQWHEIPKHRRIRPKDFKDELLPLKPDKYSPMLPSGDGFTAYLFEMPNRFADVLLGKMNSPVEWRMAQELVAQGAYLRRLGEDRVESFLRRSPLDETEKATLIAARRGQGRFREGVSYVEPQCRFTGVRNPVLLVASHIKPWYRCHTNDERLDPFNGLMLTPTFDRLFDRGLVTFSPDSQLLVSPSLPREDIRKIHMDPAMTTPPFRPEQQKYFHYHREHVFQAA
jgi:putative restriction endonuclease